MSEYKENHNEVLFTASVIVCILRYLAILLPDMPFFSIFRSLEKAPQQYCLDFAIIVIFIVTSCTMLSRKTEKERLLYWTEGISFAALVPAWRYIVDLFDWLETGDLSEITIIIRNAEGIFEVIILSLAVCFFIGFVIILLRYNDKIKNFLHSCFAFIKKDLFLAQFIIIMMIIHLLRLCISFFAANNSNISTWLLSEISGMDFVLTVAFFIALLIILLHCRKREDTFTPAVWFAIVLCLFGIVPVRNDPAKMIRWFISIVVLIIAAALLVSGYRYLRSGKIKETKIWRSFHGDGMVELIQEHMYELSGNFINIVFLPFRFLFSYIDMLGAALLDDDNDDTDDSIDNSEDNQDNKEYNYKNSSEDKIENKKENNSGDDYKNREDKEDSTYYSSKDKNIMKKEKKCKKIEAKEKEYVKRLEEEYRFAKVKAWNRRMEGENI